MSLRQIIFLMFRFNILLPKNLFVHPFHYTYISTKIKRRLCIMLATSIKQIEGNSTTRFSRLSIKYYNDIVSQLTKRQLYVVIYWILFNQTISQKWCGLQNNLRCVHMLEVEQPGSFNLVPTKSYSYLGRIEKSLQNAKLLESFFLLTKSSEFNISSSNQVISNYQHFSVLILVQKIFTKRFKQKIKLGICNIDGLDIKLSRQKF